MLDLCLPMLSVLITKTFGNKRSRKAKGQSRMDNTEILSKLGTQEIGRSQRKLITDNTEILSKFGTQEIGRTGQKRQKSNIEN